MESLNFDVRVEHDKWLLPRGRYDCRSTLLEEERLILEGFLRSREEGKKEIRLIGLPVTLRRLYEPLDAALAVTRAKQEVRNKALYLFLRQIHNYQALYWGWSHAEWLGFFNTNPRLVGCQNLCGQYLIASAYLLVGFSDFRAIKFYRSSAVVAARIFGRDTLDEAAQRIYSELVRLNYRQKNLYQWLKGPIGDAMLRVGSPHLEDITLSALIASREESNSKSVADTVSKVSYALFSLGIINETLQAPNAKRQERSEASKRKKIENIPVEWVSWCQRWFETATQSERSRQGIFDLLLKAGRWLASTYPEISSPAQWTREIAVSYVAAVDKQSVGEWCVQTPASNVGKPLKARTKDGYIAALRTFFSDCQSWGWLPRRFDPHRYLVTPRSVKAQVAPKPRVIKDEVWAKLLWAGMNLTEADLTNSETGRISGKYPFAMVKAVAVTWLFAGLRADEIRRLRMDCIRWPSTSAEGEPTVCWLEVPVNKSGPAFTKPVEAVVGQAIEAWQEARPASPMALDSKTGEKVHYLFCYRSMRLGVRYLNETLIPLLCQKAQIPSQDVIGKLTSHRARATIASQLANAEEPMSLLALQEWLGHQSASATLHYVKDNPIKLTQAYTNAGYFGRNVRLVEVLIDKEAIQNGSTLQGEPWQFYDLGHGYCTYDFFDQCPHRMACAKCDFYRPKAATAEQLKEAHTNLLRMVQAIPLTEDEQLAVKEGLDAISKLCARLADTPTPAGPTPRQLRSAQEQGIVLLDEISVANEKSE